jgi:hypothetical protein
LKVKRVFIPGFVTFKIDICDFFKAQSDGLLSQLIPSVRTMFSTVIHPCPYNVSRKHYKKIKIILFEFILKGRVEMCDYQVDGEILTKFLTTGSYRFDFNISDGKETIFFKMRYYFYINGGI